MPELVKIPLSSFEYIARFDQPYVGLISTVIRKGLNGSGTNGSSISSRVLAKGCKTSVRLVAAFVIPSTDNGIV